MFTPDRAVLVRYTVDGRQRRGSGLRIGCGFVLTADHCARGAGHTVIIDGNALPAAVHVRSNSSLVDLAILEIEEPAAIDRMRCAFINRAIIDQVRSCVVVGFPKWRDDEPGSPALAQTGGYIPTAEGLGSGGGQGLGLLSFKIDDPATVIPEVEVGKLDRSQWAGMSGAAVVTPDDFVVGVIKSHTLAHGPQSLTMTGLDSINRLPEPTNRRFWLALGVREVQEVPLLPSAIDPLRLKLQRIRKLEMDGDIYIEAAIQAQTQILVAELQGGGGRDE